MGEIIHIQVGRGGNRIGSQFWEEISKEHGIESTGVYRGNSSKQLDRINVYYKEENGKYVPRAILTSCEPGTKDSVLAERYAQIFRPDNFLFDEAGCGNCWCKGYYHEGAQLCTSVLEVVRQEAERCDKLQGFQIAHTLGGGVGSGMGSLLTTRLREEYSDQMILTFSVLPTDKMNWTGFDSYNAVLSINKLICNADSVAFFGNSALYTIVTKALKQPNPTYDDFNKLISAAMSGITCCFRFPGQVNPNLRELAANLNPSPRLHFLMVGIAPLSSSLVNQNRTAAELAAQIFQSTNMMVEADPMHGVYLAASAIFRGSMSAQQVDESIKAVQTKSSNVFTESTHMKSSVCTVLPKNLQASATSISNNTAIGEMLKKFSDDFTNMFRAKKFLQLYTGAGMDESEFTEAESAICDLMSSYRQAGDIGTPDV